MWKPPDVRISGGFFLLWGWFVLSCGLRAAWLVLSAAVLHEAGHLLILRLCRVPVRQLRLGVLGAVLETAGTMGYGQELLAALSGPGSNLLWAMLLSRLGDPAAAGANAVLGLFNLLPIYPLDGGRALEALLCLLTGPQTAEWVRRWVGTAAALHAVAAVVFLMGRTGGSLWLLPMAAGLVGLMCRSIWPAGGTGEGTGGRGPRRRALRVRRRDTIPGMPSRRF